MGELRSWQTISGRQTRVTKHVRRQKTTSHAPLTNKGRATFANQRPVLPWCLSFWLSLTRKDKMGFTAGRQEVRRECGGKDRISHFLVFISMMDSVGMVEEDIPTLYYSVCGEKWLNIPSPNDTTFLSEYPLQKIQDSTPVSPSARTHFYFSFNWMIKPIRNQNIISSPTFRHFITFARRHPEVNFRFLSPGNLTGNNSRLLLFSLFLFFFLFLFLFPS